MIFSQEKQIVKFYLFLVGAFVLIVACNKDQLLTPNPEPYTISGRVTQNGLGLSGVVMSDGHHIATTDSMGKYAILYVSGGTRTVRAVKNGCSFLPDSQLVFVSGSSRDDVNFIALASGIQPQFKRCTFEAHGIVLAQNTMHFGIDSSLKAYTTTTTQFDTLNFVFSAFRNLADPSIILFDVNVPSPGPDFSEWVNNQSILVRMGTPKQLGAVTYMYRIRQRSTIDLGSLYIDSIIVSFSPVFTNTPYTYRISGNTLLLTSAMNISQYTYQDFRPLPDISTTSTVRYFFLPDAEIIIRLEE